MGDDPASAFERLEERGKATQPTLAEERRLRRLAADLQAADPELDLSEHGLRFCLQLGHHAGRPVVIDIRGTFDITMSWSYARHNIQPALAAAESYLPVFERYGYVAFDPQLGHVFNPSWSATVSEAHQTLREQVGLGGGVRLRNQRP